MKKRILIGLLLYVIAATSELLILNYVATYDTSMERVVKFAAEARREISRSYSTNQKWSSGNNYCKKFDDGFFSYHLCAFPLYLESCPSPVLVIGLVPQEPIFTPEPILGVDRLRALNQPVVRLDANNNLCQ